MQLLNTPPHLDLSPFASVSAEACVVGGPASQVTFAKGCCFNNARTWYQFYDVQAICVFADHLESSYKRCVGYIPYSQLDTVCIPGDGGIGLTTATLTESATSRITFLPPASTLTTALIERVMEGCEERRALKPLK